ncbi:hypothetical protein AVEN_92958-1 [Araneus ventricosus]|uniref:Amidase domain-containing protein n=1 Tax=Araneus ventricosus TaxID=182803 RepID=A0A4Y2GJX0_ARAVE|nr:hypothetical protein AVEN_92958-1 [Araneus ventricosus]
MKGGEAALLASAGAIIGIGTDIGGSIRIPSAFCGTYGHKPSRVVVKPDMYMHSAHRGGVTPTCFCAFYLS